MVDLAQYAIDRGRAEWRLSRYQGLGDNPEVKAAFDAYHNQVWKELEWRSQGYTNEQIEHWMDPDVGPDLVRVVKENHGFSIPAKRWVEEQELYSPEEFPARLQEMANYFSGRGNVWNKIGPWEAEKLADRSDGIILETTPGAVALNELHYGTGGYPDYTPTMKQVWDLFSENYTGGLRGEIAGNVFRGIMKPSVLDTTEWPRILKMIENGENDVPHMRVNLLKMNDAGELETVDSLIVHSQASYDLLPEAQRTPSFVEQQEGIYQRTKEERRKYYNRIGLQNSMSSFENAVRNPSEYRIVLTDPNAPHVELTESPKQLSRTQSNTSSSKSSSSNGKKGKGKGKADATGLERMLATVAREQGRRASEASSSQLVDSFSNLSFPAAAVTSSPHQGNTSGSDSEDSKDSRTGSEGSNVSDPATRLANLLPGDSVYVPGRETLAANHPNTHVDVFQRDTTSGVDYTSDFEQIRTPDGIVWDRVNATTEAGIQKGYYSSRKTGYLGVYAFSPQGNTWNSYPGTPAETYAPETSSQSLDSVSHAASASSGGRQGRSRR